MSEEKTIGERIRDWGVGKYGSVNALADALGVAQESVSAYLNDRRRPGVNFQEKLKSLGADVDWVMTGRQLSETDNNEIRIHFSGNPSEQLKRRAERMAQWLVDHGTDADQSLVGYVAQQIYQGKIVDGKGAEIGRDN